MAAPDRNAGLTPLERSLLRQESTKGFFAFQAGFFEFRTEFNLAEKRLGPFPSDVGRERFGEARGTMSGNWRGEKCEALYASV